MIVLTNDLILTIEKGSLDLIMRAALLSLKKTGGPVLAKDEIGDLALTKGKMGP